MHSSRMCGARTGRRRVLNGRLAIDYVTIPTLDAKNGSWCSVVARDCRVGRRYIALVLAFGLVTLKPPSIGLTALSERR